MSAIRKPCVAGNWKMMGSRASIHKLMEDFKKNLPDLPSVENIDIVLCPPFPYLSFVEQLKISHVALGAQNVYYEPDGAFTGEVSVSMLKDFNCKYVIIGHSERRQWFKETDEVIARKFRAAYDAGLIPILCVGETIAERSAGQTLNVVADQLDAVLKETGPEAFKRALLAYEPVWAIGTGQTATPEQAQEVHRWLRSQFNTSGEDCSQQVRILYGGSVKSNNASALFAMPDIDGALVGGASLNAEEFLSICRSAILSTL